MVISLIFSIIIYSISTSEVRSRIIALEQNAPSNFGLARPRYDTFRDAQVHEAETNLLSSLAITNLAIWVAGGIGSYYLARRTLFPIEEAHEAQSRFTSDASHELRTPLASMKTELEVALRSTELSREEMRELLESNLEEVDKLTKLSQNLLQLSRLDHDSIEREKVTLNAIASSVIERFDKTGKRVQLSGHKSYDVVANKSNIEELLTILVDNAFKYSPPNSPIKINLIGHRQMAGFEVANEGKGIAPEALPHIFDRFYRADTSRTNDEKKGYGLGLSLAKKIVQLHNGDLTVTSGSGHLTTFRVLLPNFSKSQANNQQSTIHSVL
ncbi:MAG: putative Histidine kinase [Candidatus Saccharibacteria bacterium]|nr:putative Histidine kinase [Candidatus Saccharibacteria bacterium]